MLKKHLKNLHSQYFASTSLTSIHREESPISIQTQIQENLGPELCLEENISMALSSVGDIDMNIIPEQIEETITIRSTACHNG